MFYSVFIAEDEPVANRHLRMLIEQKCPEFRIVGFAESGEEALDAFETYKPDLLLTDIKMPGMNGIELAEEAKMVLPSLRCVIISGYRNFNYTRDALHAGFDDYLLKPVTPKNFTEVMQKIAGDLDELYYRERCTLFRCLAADIYVEPWKLEKYLDDGSYYLGIIREGGLPRRFRNLSIIEQFSDRKDAFYLYGRDEKEALLLCPCKTTAADDFRSLLSLHKMKIENGFTTIIMLDEPVSPEEIPEGVIHLYQGLRNSLILGQNQFLTLTDEILKGYTGFALGIPDIERIRQFAQRGMKDALKNEIDLIVRRAAKKSCPQIYLEDIVRQFFYMVRMYADGRDTSDVFEYTLDDSFFFALNSEDLSLSLQDLIERIFEKTFGLPKKIDSLGTFEKIRQYMQRHLPEKLGIKDLCHEFGISQSYMSRLFRKYTGNSFNEYLVKLRIELAKKIMKESPDALIKTIADMVGYDDQLYFSRLFSASAGESPSMYLSRLQERKSLRRP
jgi:two-component system response regulator YesN